MFNSTDFGLSYEILSHLSSLPLIVMVMGIIGNFFAFLIFTFDPYMSEFSSTVYLSFIAAIDTFGLFQWNLDRFLASNFGIMSEDSLKFYCKIEEYVQYSALQSSGYLYSFMSADRFFTIIAKPGSFSSKLPFGTRRTAYIWSVCIITVVLLINVEVTYNLTLTNIPIKHTLTLPNGTYYNVTTYAKDCYGIFDEAWPFMDYQQFALYAVASFIIIGVFNALLITNLVFSSKAKRIAKAEIHRLTISLITLVFVFLLMVAPGTMYAVFSSDLYYGKKAHMAIIFLNSLMYLQQTMMFFTSILTNRKFAKIVIYWLKKIFLCKK